MDQVLEWEGLFSGLGKGGDFRCIKNSPERGEKNWMSFGGKCFGLREWTHFFRTKKGERHLRGSAY